MEAVAGPAHRGGRAAVDIQGGGHVGGAGYTGGGGWAYCGVEGIEGWRGWRMSKGCRAVMVGAGRWGWVQGGGGGCRTVAGQGKENL